MLTQKMPWSEQPSFDLKAYLEERANLVNQWLKANLPVPEGPHAPVIEAMRYSTLCGGKRVRPLLLMAAADAVGAKGPDFLAIASAIECIHTYSLIHDDLPAMDDDELRRGQPTCHKVFGEAIAILAGDALLNYAFEILSSTHVLQSNIPVEVLIRAIGVISRASGVLGMVGGQAADVIMEGRTVDEETLNFIHNHKTGALIRACVESGAILGQGSEEQVEALRRFGTSLGMLFQIKDDLLDVEGDEALLGKKVGKDAKRSKATYPALFGIEKTKQKAKELLSMCISDLEGFGKEADPLRAISHYVVQRRR